MAGLRPGDERFLDSQSGSDTSTIRQKLISLSTTLAFLILIAAVLLVSFYYFCVRMPGESWTGELPELNEQGKLLSSRLTDHVYFLAGEIGIRYDNSGDSLERAADYIENQFLQMNYVPRSEAVNDREARNIVVELYGNSHRDEIIVVGAHYDTNWASPGADDNASGVAGMLEIARQLREKEMARTVRFVAFVNEEFPHYGTDDMGSRHHADRAREKGENIVGMLSLEMIGYYSDEPKSQWYPRPVRPFFPRTGNFIAILSNLVSRPFQREVIGTFRDVTQFPSQGLSAPQILVRGLRRSDNVSFWANGYPAVMVTDTARYRNYAYHNSTDKPDTLDYDRMTIVVQGLIKTIETLANK